MASRFEILADRDEELEFEAPPGLEMRTASALSRRRPRRSWLEVTIDSGAEESVIPRLKIRGQEKGDRGSEWPMKWATTAAKR